MVLQYCTCTYSTVVVFWPPVKMPRHLRLGGVYHSVVSNSTPQRHIFGQKKIDQSTAMLYFTVPLPPLLLKIFIISLTC